MIDPKKLKVASIRSAVYLICVGGLWVWFSHIAKISGRKLYVAGSFDALPYWQWYLAPIYWLAIAGVSLIFVWEFTPKDARSQSTFGLLFESKKINHVCLVAMVFFGLGSVIGKSSDPIEQNIGSLSLIIFMLLVVRMLAKWTLTLIKVIHRRDEAKTLNGTGQRKAIILSLCVRLLAVAMLFGTWSDIQARGLGSLLSEFHLGMWAGVVFYLIFISLSVLAVVLPFRISCKVLANRFWFGLLLIPFVLFIADHAISLFSSTSLSWLQLLVQVLMTGCTGLLFWIHLSIRKGLRAGTTVMPE